MQVHLLNGSRSRWGGGGEGEAEAVLIFARKDQLARRVTIEKQNRTYLKSWDAV